MTIILFCSKKISLILKNVRLQTQKFTASL
jgi:hypothetical protein